MSWFETSLGADLSSGEAPVIADTELDVAVADGVVVERRSVLWLSAAAVASVLVGPRVAAQGAGKPGPGEAGRLSFAQFIDEVYPLARKVVDTKGADEEAYLMTVAAAMTRLTDPGAELRATMRGFPQKHRREGERFPLAAVAMRLEPGGGFAHHDHRDYNGVIMGLEGEVRIRNYDILGDDPVPPEGKTFEIRETRDDLILPGRISSLGRRRENVHDLVAGPDGARVLDVFTFFAPGANSYYLDVEAKPRDAERRIYEAAWKPRRRR